MTEDSNQTETESPLLAANLKDHRAYRIHPHLNPAYTPHVAVLVDMLTYTRLTTLHAVAGLSAAQLEAVPAGFSNSIGLLLAHMAAVESAYAIWTFEDRDLNPENPGEQRVLGGLTMGQDGIPPQQGRTLDDLLDELATVRASTLRAFEGKDEAWLASKLCLPDFDYPNKHWAWFHVMEDEVSHRGQIRLLRKIVAPKQD